MGFLFRLPGDSSGVVIQYRPNLVVSALLPSHNREISVYENRFEIKVPNIVLSQFFPTGAWWLADVGTFRSGLKYSIHEAVSVGAEAKGIPYRIGNVARDASICWGAGNSIPYDLRSAWQTYWSASFNSDLTEDLLQALTAESLIKESFTRITSKAFNPQPLGVIRDKLSHARTDISQFMDLIRSLSESIVFYTELFICLRGVNELLHDTPEFLGDFQKYSIQELHENLKTLRSVFSESLAVDALAKCEKLDVSISRTKKSLLLLSESKCPCLICVASCTRYTNALISDRKRLVELHQLLVGTDGSLLDDRSLLESVFSTYSVLRRISEAISFCLDSTVNDNFAISPDKYKTVMPLHVKNYSGNPKYLVDLTATIFGKSYMAFPLHVDAVYVSTDSNEINMIPEEAHKSIGNHCKCILAPCIRLSDGTYIADFGPVAMRVVRSSLVPLSKDELNKILGSKDKETVDVPDLQTT